MNNKSVKIRSRKFDGRIHRTWQAELVSNNGDELVFRGEFDRDFSHPDLGEILLGTISYEYYWLSRWFNVFRFHEPDGRFRNFYCNINMPPVFDDGILDYVDLDIDLLVRHDWSIKILDRDEFERNAEIFGYGKQIVEKAENQVSILRSMISNREFPFDFTETT